MQYLLVKAREPLTKSVYARDMLGDTVEVKPGALHLARYSELDWYRDRPEYFEWVTTNADIVVYAKDEDGNIIGFYDAHGNVQSSLVGQIDYTQIDGLPEAVQGLVNLTVVGLDQVDNVRDADKPISSDTQAALDTKANRSEVSTLDNALTALMQRLTTAEAEIAALKAGGGNQQGGGNASITSVEVINTAESRQYPLIFTENGALVFGENGSVSPVVSNTQPTTISSLTNITNNTGMDYPVIFEQGGLLTFSSTGVVTPN